MITVALLASLSSAARAQDATESKPDVPRVTTVGTDLGYVHFDQGLDAWKLASISLGQRTSAGSIIGRVNIADRFGTTGNQVEVDAYPHLGNGKYAYLSVGYSGSAIFPAWRSGAELFTSLPDAWEASLGYRQLRFSGTPTTLFTGAVGKYVGNYWFSARPYLHWSGSGPSASASITARRYYADGDHYIGARAGYGSTPPDVATLDAASLARLRSFSASMQGSGGLAGGVLGTWSVAYEHEALTTTTIRRSVASTIGLRVPF